MSRSLRDLRKTLDLDPGPELDNKNGVLWSQTRMRIHMKNLGDRLLVSVREVRNFLAYHSTDKY